jgi:hypothetical protein
MIASRKQLCCVGVAQERELYKHAWPRKEQCPECWKGVSDYYTPVWDEPAVLDYIQV